MAIQAGPCSQNNAYITYIPAMLPRECQNSWFYHFRQHRRLQRWEGCEGTAGLEYRVLFHTSSWRATVWEAQRLLCSRACFQPRLLSAAMCINMDELIKLIHDYQMFHSELFRMFVVAIASEWPVLVQRPPDQEGHPHGLNTFPAFKFKEELHRPLGHHNYNHNANVQVRTLTCPWLLKSSQTDGL